METYFFIPAVQYFLVLRNLVTYCILQYTEHQDCTYNIVLLNSNCEYLAYKNFSNTVWKYA
jgi:hypothetical protein